jgi:hypothetical protein
MLDCICIAGGAGQLAALREDLPGGFVFDVSMINLSAEYKIGQRPGICLLSAVSGSLC